MQATEAEPCARNVFDGAAARRRWHPHAMREAPPLPGDELATPPPELFNRPSSPDW